MTLSYTQESYLRWQNCVLAILYREVSVRYTHCNAFWWNFVSYASRDDVYYSYWWMMWRRPGTYHKRSVWEWSRGSLKHWSWCLSHWQPAQTHSCWTLPLISSSTTHTLTALSTSWHLPNASVRSFVVLLCHKQGNCALGLVSSSRVIKLSRLVHCHSCFSINDSTVSSHCRSFCFR